MLGRCSVAIEMTLVISLMFSSAVAHGQAFPSKPIRIVTSEAGGGNDFRARLIAPTLTQNLGQAVVVDNRGGNPVIPVDAVIKSAPDGYSLLIGGTGTWLLPFMMDVAYDPIRDLAPITMLTTSAAVIVVNPSMPVKSIKELIAVARARPGELNYSSGISGSTTHLPAELFKSMAGVNIVRVPFKGAAPAVQAILAGQTQVMFASPSSVMSHIKAGKLRALAVTTPQPTKMFPDLPTVASAGLPGYDAGSAVGIFAPGKAPMAVVRRLNAEIVKVLNASDVKEKFENSGNDVVGDSPEEFMAYVKADMARMGKVIRDAGIRDEGQ